MIKFYFKIGGRNVASAHFKDDNWLESGDKTFILEKGSELKELKERLRNIYKGVFEKKKNLIKELKFKNGKLTEDIECTTPSQAGILVSGSESNGLSDFKDKDGNSINDYYNKNIKIKEENFKDVLFNKDQIENTQIKIVTKNVPREDRIEEAYEAFGYEELLLSTATAINLNHTSLFVAEKLCNAIPDEFWNDKNIWQKKILNPFGDSGFLEKYIVTCLMKNEHMIKKFPDYGMRAFWILHNMMFSIAKTNAASYWLRKIVYYSADTTIRGGDNYPAMFHGKLFTQGADKEKLESYHKYGNIKSPLLSDCGENNIFDYPILDWIKNGKDFTEYVARVFWDVFCNEEYETIEEERRKKIMSEIKKKLDGYFDVIIGNPPYNTNNEETGAVDETIYDKFCMAANVLNPKYVSFIIPSKWIYGKARIPNEFSQNILTNNHLAYLEIMDGKIAFPNVETGEILIYTLNNTKKVEKLKFIYYNNKYEKTLDEITYQNGKNYWFKPTDSIVEKIQTKKLKSLANDTKVVSADSGIIYNNHGSDLLGHGSVGLKYDGDKLIIDPNGNRSKRPTIDYSLYKTDEYSVKVYIPNVKLWKKQKNGNYERPSIDPDKTIMMTHVWIKPSTIKSYNDFNKHPLLCTTSIFNYKDKSLNYPYNAFIVNTGEIFNEHFAIGISLTNLHEIKNLQKFIKTKFVTYLIYINTVSQHFTAETLRFVPYMDFTQEWTDEKLNKFFDLDDEEIKRINDLWAEFRPMYRAQLQELEENIEEGDDSEDNE